MKVLNKLRQFIKKMDLFAETGLLRYQEQSQYSTFFGGFCSLAIILIVLIIFYGRIRNTFRRTEIKYWVEDNSSTIPAPYSLGYQNDFMFGLSFYGMNLSDISQPRYFDLIFEYYQADEGDLTDNNIKYHHLQPCTENHWNKSPSVLAQTKRIDYTKWLCMPLKKNFQIKGKLSSSVYNYIILTASKCTNSSFYAQPCASQEQIDAFFKREDDIMYFRMFFMSATINPNDKDVVQYNLQDKHIIPFTKTYGANTYVMLQQFQVRTDYSITPIADISTIKGIKLSSENSRKDFFLRDSSVNLKRYSSFRFMKSTQAKIYHRSCVKLDQTLSYLGGLIQTIIFCLIIIKMYASYAFQIDIAAHLFSSQRKGTSKPLREYHFLKFILHILYKALNMIGIQPNWKASKQYFETKKQILQQLDVRFLFKRIMFLEKTLQILLTDHERKALVLQKRMTITQAKKTRKNYKERIKYLKLWQNLLQTGQFTNNFQGNSPMDNRIQSSRQFVQNTNTLKDINNNNINYKGKFDNNDNPLADTKAKIKQKIEEENVSQEDSDLEYKDQRDLQSQKQQFCKNLLGIQNEILDKQERMGRQKQNKGQIWYNMDPQIKKMFLVIQKRLKVSQIQGYKQQSDNEQVVNGLQIKLNSYHGSIKSNSKSLHADDHPKNRYQLQNNHNKTNNL